MKRYQTWLLHIGALTVITIIALVGMHELLLPGYYESHDGIIHVMRLAHFYRAFSLGQFPVRWLADWMAGYGSPVFNFNWSLPYYMGSAFHVAGVSFEGSIKAVFILGFILSGLFCYLFVHELTRHKGAALVASILYLWAPYRFTDILIRGALGEATSFVFFPLVFWFALKAARHKLHAFSLWSALVWALFILTHNIMSLVGVGLFFLYVLYLEYKVKARGRLFLSACFVCALGVGISAFFWLPAVVEKKYDEISNLSTLYNYRSQFPSLTALVNSKWQYAYSVPLKQDSSFSFQVGWVHLAAGLIGICLFFWYIHKKQRAPARELAFFVIVSLLSLLLTQRISETLYEIPIVSNTINFPWRFLEIVTFTTSIVGGILITKLPRRGGIFLIAGIILATVALYWPFSQLVSWRLSYSDRQYGMLVKTNINYMPDTEFLPIDTHYVKLFEDRGEAQNHTYFERADGEPLTATYYSTRDLERIADVRLERGAQIQANVFYFPGWNVLIDGKETLVSKDAYGLIVFNVPAGSHRIEIRFSNTPIRNVAEGISIASFVCMLFVGVYQFLFRHKTLKTANL